MNKRSIATVSLSGASMAIQSIPADKIFLVREVRSRMAGAGARDVVVAAAGRRRGGLTAIVLCRCCEPGEIDRSTTEQG